MKAQNDKHIDKRISLMLSSVNRRTNEPDKQFLEKLREQSMTEFESCLAGSSKKLRKIINFSKWRTIMKSRITKIAAAAAIIIIAVVGFYLYTGSFHGTTAAFAMSDVIAAMRQVNWTHATEQGIDANNVPAEISDFWEGRDFWQSIDPYRTVSVGEYGDIEFTDLNSRKVYDPKNNTITVTLNYHPVKDPPGSMQEVWLNCVSGLEKSGAKVEYSDSMYEGRPAKIIFIDYTKESGWHEEITIVADAKTRLARKIAIYQKTTEGEGMSGTILMLIDYPSTGPKDIYEAGAPRDAVVKVIDNSDEEK
jgi:hypothetical protein